MSDNGKYHRKGTSEKTKDNFATLCKDSASSSLMVYIDPKGHLKTWCKYIIHLYTCIITEVHKKSKV